MVEQLKLNMPSVRTIIDGLILTVLIWVGGTIESLHTDMAKTQVQLANVQEQLAVLPAMKTSIDQMSVTQTDHERRLDSLESKR